MFYIVQIGVIEEKQYDDAFTLQSVDQPLEEIFNKMAGMVPFIQKLVLDVCILNLLFTPCLKMIYY